MTRLAERAARERLPDIYAGAGGWNNISNSQTLGQSNQYIDTLNTGNAYAAVVLSTPVNNSDGDGILDAWKATPGLHRRERPDHWCRCRAQRPAKRTSSFNSTTCVPPSLADGVTCDFTQPNLYPSPDAQGNDPLAMVTQAFLNSWSASPSETRKRDSRKHVHVHRQRIGALRVPQHHIGPAAGGGRLEWRRGTLEDMAGQFQCLHDEPVDCQSAHLVSRLARRTAITTFCSVTLLRYRPGTVGLDR